MKTARHIAEDILESTGEALRTGDFDLFISYFHVPLEIETFDGQRSLNTVHEVREVFNAVRQHLIKEDVTDLVRTCVEASFRDPQTIVHTHESRLLRKATLVQQPYFALSILKKFGDDWKIVHAEYALEGSPSLSKALMGNESVVAAK